MRFRYSGMLLSLIAIGIVSRAILGWMTGAPIFMAGGVMGVGVVVLALLIPIGLAMDVLVAARGR